MCEIHSYREEDRKMKHVQNLAKSNRYRIRKIYVNSVEKFDHETQS